MVGAVAKAYDLTQPRPCLRSIRPDLLILSYMVDDGHAIHYTAVERGTPVHASDGSLVGKVDEVVDNFDEHILDGIVIEDGDGKLRFVDGPEVGRTAERAVTLTITAAEVEQLPPPQKAPPRFSPGRSRGRLGRLLGGGGWKRR